MDSKQHQLQKQQGTGIGNKMSSPTANERWFVLVVCVSLGVILALDCANQVNCQEQVTVESRQQKDRDNELADTINYLEKLENLDKYWSEVARPRFGRSKYKQTNAMVGRGDFGLEKSPHYYGSLVDLINSRMAQKYYSNDAY